MKKIYSILMLGMLAVCSMALVACGDDDEESSDGLVGTWRCTESDGYQEVTFKSNNTFIWTDLYEGEKETLSGRYAVNGDKLTMHWEDGDTQTATYRITSGILWLAFESDGFELEVPFKRR